VTDVGERAEQDALEYRGGDAVIATAERAVANPGEKAGDGLTLARYAY